MFITGFTVARKWFVPCPTWIPVGTFMPLFSVSSSSSVVVPRYLQRKHVYQLFPSNGRLFWLHSFGLSAALSQYRSTRIHGWLDEHLVSSWTVGWTSYPAIHKLISHRSGGDGNKCSSSSKRRPSNRPQISIFFSKTALRIFIKFW
jgi:hypothetical protein